MSKLIQKFSPSQAIHNKLISQFHDIKIALQFPQQKKAKLMARKRKRKAKTELERLIEFLFRASKWMMMIKKSTYRKYCKTLLSIVM